TTVCPIIVPLLFGSNTTYPPLPRAPWGHSLIAGPPLRTNLSSAICIRIRKIRRALLDACSIFEKESLDPNDRLRRSPICHRSPFLSRPAAPRTRQHRALLHRPTPRFPDSNRPIGTGRRRLRSPVRPSRNRPLATSHRPRRRRVSQLLPGIFLKFSSRLTLLPRRARTTRHSPFRRATSIR